MRTRLTQGGPFLFACLFLGLQIIGTWGNIVVYCFQMLFKRHLKICCMTDLHVILENVIFLKGRNTVNCGLKAIVSVTLIKGKPVLSCTSEMMKCP